MCISTASAVPRLGVQRALRLPECATPPEEVYAMAKRRGMDFVTITDHDTIAGAQAIRRLPTDTFVSEELTDPVSKTNRRSCTSCATGSTADDHDWLQAHVDDLEACAEYLQGERGITAALAHPFYAVGGHR